MAEWEDAPSSSKGGWEDAPEADIKPKVSIGKIAKEAVTGEGEFSKLGKRQREVFEKATTRDVSKAGQVPFSEYVKEAKSQGTAGAALGGGLSLLAGPEAVPVGAFLGGLGGVVSGVTQSALKDLGYKQGVQTAGSIAASLAVPTNIPPFKNMLSSVTENALNNGIISRAQKFLEDARGKVAQEMSTRFGGQVGEKVSGVISKAEQAEALPTRQLEAATKAQAELASREPVAAARQAAREKQVSSSLDTLSTEKGVLPEDLGGVIQQTGRKNIEGLKEARTKQAITETKDPAFRAAREREAGGDFISNNQASAGEFNNVIKKINTEIERTPEPYRNTLKTRLQAMLGTERKLTPEEAKMEEFKAGFTPGYQPKTSVAEPMTMDQAEFLRRMLEKNDLGKVEGFEALDATRMSSIAKDLRSAMNKYDDRFGEYLRKYKEGSEDITKAVSGRGKRLTDVDMANEENALFSADKKAATNYYLDGSQERAQRLLDLTGGKTPEVMNSVKGYIRSEMEGMNAKQASDFVKKHEGMLREFPELRQPMEGIVSSKSVAETAGVSAEKRAVEAGKRLEARVKLSERSIDEQQKVVQQYGALRNKLETAIDSNKPQQVISTSKQIADNLLADKQISLKDHKELLGKISDIEAKYGKTKKAQEMIKKATYKTLGYGLVGVAGLEAGKSLLGD